MGEIYCVAAAVALFAYIAKWVLASPSTSSPTEEDPEQELCTKCQYDVRGLETCPECGSKTRTTRRNALMKLRDEWPFESIKPRTAEPDEMPVVILTTQEEQAIRLLRQHLEARGIRARTSRSRNHSNAFQPSPVLSYRLTVWSADEERARAIVEYLWPADARSEQ